MTGRLVAHIAEEAFCVAIILGAFALLIASALGVRHSIEEDTAEIDVPPFDMFGEPLTEWERDEIAERIRDMRAADLLEELWQLPAARVNR